MYFCVVTIMGTWQFVSQSHWFGVRVGGLFCMINLAHVSSKSHIAWHTVTPDCCVGWLINSLRVAHKRLGNYSSQSLYGSIVAHFTDTFPSKWGLLNSFAVSWRFLLTNLAKGFLVLWVVNLCNWTFNAWLSILENHHTVLEALQTVSDLPWIMWSPPICCHDL